MNNQYQGLSYKIILLLKCDVSIKFLCDENAEYHRVHNAKLANGGVRIEFCDGDVDVYNMSMLDSSDVSIIAH